MDAVRPGGHERSCLPGVRGPHKGRTNEVHNVRPTLQKPPRLVQLRLRPPHIRRLPRIRQPVRSTYRGYEIYGMPAPSSGGIAIAQALNLLETFDLAGKPRAEIEHLYLEASRLAFADRNAYVADATRVPDNLARAVQLWEDSNWVRETFGEEVQAHYARMGRVELEAFGRAVTDWERYRGFERL